METGYDPRAAGARKLVAALLAAATLACLAAGADAATTRMRSQYTAIDADECLPEAGPAGGTGLRCRGVGGIDVFYERDRERSYIAFEPAAAKGRSQRTTLKPANAILVPKTRPRAMIEWRVARPEGKPIPYAAIVRYITTGGGRSGEVLVVSKVGETGSCPVAYIDALANPEAIVLAREIADRRAREFDCSKPPVVEGLTGKSPM